MKNKGLKKDLHRLAGTIPLVHETYTRWDNSYGVLTKITDVRPINHYNRLVKFYQQYGKDRFLDEYMNFLERKIALLKDTNPADHEVKNILQTLRRSSKVLPST